jgi:hypothetical protein
LSGLDKEVAAFCLCWALLAGAGFILSGWGAAVALSAGLFPLIFGTSAIILSRGGDFAVERGVRWAILAAAAAVFFLYSSSSS